MGQKSDAFSDRDAAFVLDGLRYNESELEIEEHYTDTHGYTEINFAAFAMLGLRFCPRIRGVQHQRIYRIDPNCDYGSLISLVSRADQTIDTVQIAEQWDRMGQLYASLKTGQVTTSVALKRLVGFSAKNRFYRANRDLGRIFKTEFIHPPRDFAFTSGQYELVSFRRESRSSQAPSPLRG
jgi:TnpA family transposase